jgi:hypothetical protein
MNMRPGHGWIRILCATALLGGAAQAIRTLARAGQVPVEATDPDIPLSHHDRVYAAEQFSNTVSVVDPADNMLLGVIRLVILHRRILVLCTRGSCWCTAWVSHPTIGRSP